jgi:Major Facilitator Superfamily
MRGAVRPTPDQTRNYHLVQVDSVFVGIVAAAGTFLPVFLVRLGASGAAVGLLTAIPALVAFTLAIPFGRWLQGRRNIVPWYSRLRLAGWLSYGTMGVASALLPADVAVPVILGVWALASLPATAGLVAFPIVMDGAAGPHGRFDLLGRRWAISGLVTSLSVVIAGQALTIFAFPTNFAILFVAISTAGLGSFLVSRQIVLPDQERGGDGVTASVRARLRAPVDLVRSNPSFVRFEARSLVYTASIGLAMPLLPLFYVHELHAPNGWIGVIGASQSAGAVIGYLAVRRLSRRRSAAGILLPALLAAAAVPATMSVLAFLPAVAAAAFVGGLAAAGVQLAMFDELMRRIPRQHGVTFSSVDQSLQNFALILAPSLGGYLEVVVGIREGLIVTAVVALGAFALFGYDWWRRRRREAATPPAVEPAGRAPAPGPRPVATPPADEGPAAPVDPVDAPA